MRRNRPSVALVGPSSMTAHQGSINAAAVTRHSLRASIGNVVTRRSVASRKNRVTVSLQRRHFGRKVIGLLYITGTGFFLASSHALFIYFLCLF